MADARQVQIRRDTATALNSTTPVEAELGYDQTNKRIIIGDGSTQGGIPHSNYLDIRTKFFNRGTIGGTANVITLTMSPVSTGYPTGMEITFIATGTNTDEVTLNVDGLGAKAIQKISDSALQPLQAGDLISGCTYTILYNGSAFQLMNSAGVGSSGIKQGDLSTSSGAVTRSGTAGVNTLPGGGYGFYPTIGASSVSSSVSAHIYEGGNIAGGSSRIYLNGSSGAIGATQIYITSSPPFDLGDGETGGFFFAEVNSAGDIVSTYVADVPPWAYNGPTNIRADRVCPITGEKSRIVRVKRSFEEMMDGAKIEYKLEKISHKIKNKDMTLIPHPFDEIPKGHRVVLFDPMDDKIANLIDWQNKNGTDDVLESLRKNKFIIGDECKRCGPKGVHIHKLKYKYTKKF